MSDTPMVDDRLQFAGDVEGRQPVVLASFARHLETELNEQKAKVRNLTAWLYDIYELGADSMSVGLAVNALNGEPHDETKPSET